MVMSFVDVIGPLLALPIVLLPAIWLGITQRKAPPTLYFPTSPSELLVRSTPNKKRDDVQPERMNIRTFLESRVPSLFEGFKPTWWLPTGHFQTIYMSIGDFNKVDQVMYERTLIRLPDGGTLGLDVCPPSTTKEARELAKDTPIVIVQHGLTGGSHEPYVRSILAAACAPKKKGGLGFRAIVINFRGCADVPITSPQWYSAGHTDDLRSGLLFASESWPDAPLIGLGFSLGANILTRYLGEEGPRSRLRAGIVLACPWDTKINSHRLQKEFIPRTIYSKALGANLQSLFKSHLDEMKVLPADARMAPQIPVIVRLENPTLMDMDNHFTRVLGGNSPPFPFDTTDDYYEWAQSHTALRHIRVPFLAINSVDDPVVGFSPTGETQHSVSCALAMTARGGHLGWFHGTVNPLSRTPPDRWVRRPVLEFIRAAAEDYIPDPNIGPLPREEGVVESTSFILERGKDLVGFKVIGEGQIIHGTGHEPMRSGALVSGL